MRCVRCGGELNAALLCPKCACDQFGRPWPQVPFIYKEDFITDDPTEAAPTSWDGSE